MSGGGSGGGGQAGGSGIKAMSAKPENCAKLFIGNVSHRPKIASNGTTHYLCTHILPSPLPKKAFV
jgi:hypothetical protein